MKNIHSWYKFMPIFLMVNAPYVEAGDDSNYPAYDFEPKVTYLAEDIEQTTSQSATKSEHDPRYPAYDFEPKVIFTADENAQSTYQHSPKLKVVHDPRYPAAYFEPVSVFPSKGN